MCRPPVLKVSTFNHLPLQPPPPSTIHPPLSHPYLPLAPPLSTARTRRCDRLLRLEQAVAFLISYRAVLFAQIFFVGDGMFLAGLQLLMAADFGLMAVDAVYIVVALADEGTQVVADVDGIDDVVESAVTTGHETCKEKHEFGQFQVEELAHDDASQFVDHLRWHVFLYAGKFRHMRELNLKPSHNDRLTVCHTHHAYLRRTTEIYAFEVAFGQQVRYLAGIVGHEHLFACGIGAEQIHHRIAVRLRKAI